jgi:predicted DNA-binding transcriptional regulator AlpA
MKSTSTTAKTSVTKVITHGPTIPETGFVRLRNIIGDPKADPPIPAIIPVSRSSWWLGIKSGRYPKPTKLGPRISAWRAEDLRDFIQAHAKEE